MNTQEGLIKSISYDQVELLKGIFELYCPDGIDLDPTYSKGVFYKNLSEPRLKFDLNPQTGNCLQADCRNLPLVDSSVSSIMYDPPFVCGSVKKGKRGVIKTRFGYYKNGYELWQFYADSLREFKRVLKKKEC